MKYLKPIIYIAIALVIAFIIYKLFSKSNKLKINWTTTKIERGDLNVNVTATGTISADTTVIVGTQVSGIIAKIYVDFNSIVKKGQIIAELDKTPLIANLRDASANLAKAKASTDQAKRDYDRSTKLLAVKAIAQADYDLSLSTYQGAKAVEESAKAQLYKAEISLNYATIYAPINGVVIQRSVDVGQTVAASFNTPTLFIIAKDLTKMQVQASVDEADIGQVKLDQKVTFNVDAFQGIIFNGIVRQIRLQPTTLQNVVTYTVVIDVPNKDKKLMPGMTANITIHIQNHLNVLRVESKALRFTPPKEYFISVNKPAPIIPKIKKDVDASGILVPGSKKNIWIKDSLNIHSVEIIVGLSDGNYTEISGAIQEGWEALTGAEVIGTANQTRSPFMPTFNSKKK